MRKPTQKRSIERVAQIFGATRDLILDEGIEAVTTTRVAELAGVPVGSVYQFFTDRDDLLTSLARAQAEVVAKACVESLDQDPEEVFGHWPDAMRHVMETYLVALGRLPAGIEINRYQTQHMPVFEGPHGLESPLGRLFRDVMVRTGIQFPPEREALILTTLLATISILVDVALLQSSVGQRDAYISECLGLAQLYIEKSKMY